MDVFTDTQTVILTIFNKYISKCLTIINTEKKECYVSGDFNIDLLKYGTINKYAEFLNTLTSLGFLPHVLQPTRITEHSSTIIDNIYGNNFTQETLSDNILIKFADHFSQFLSIKKNISKKKNNVVFKRDFSSFVEADFIDDVSIQNWNANNSNDTNSKFNDFLWRVEGCVDRHAPLKRMNNRQQKKMANPWISKNIIKMISHRERLLHRKKESPCNQHLEKSYKLFRNRITREIKKAKKKYYKEYFENNINNMKKTWLGIKEIINMNNKLGPQITQLKYKGKQINTNVDMANTSNDFFTNIGPILDSGIPVSLRPDVSNIYLPPRITYSFLSSPTNPQEISDLINSLDDTKSCGPCPAPTKMLKLVSKEISIPFSIICNSSFEEGVFPDKNKIAKVIPSHKK